MQRTNRCGTTVAVIVGVVGLLLLATPAHASTITLNFSGTVDLSSHGGPAANTFSGSITWDSAALPFEEDAGSAAIYDPVIYTLIFNGVDVAAPVIGDGTGSGVVVLNNSDFLQPGVPQDALAFFLAFRPPFQIDGQNGDLALIGVLEGPVTMFGSTALPGSVDFLGQLSTTYSLWQFEADDEEGERLLNARGSLVVSHQVPEPTTLGLVGFGVLAGALRGRARRARRSATVRRRGARL